jgi:ribosomal protein L31E
MSVFINGKNSEELINIPIYYTVKKGKRATKTVVLTEEEAKKRLEDEKTKASVQVLNTVWKQLDYQQSRDIRGQANSFNSITRQIDFNYTLYRDLRFKACLVDWDSQENGVKVPVTAERINTLHPDIADAMMNEYDAAVNFTDDEEGK